MHGRGWAAPARDLIRRIAPAWAKDDAAAADAQAGARILIVEDDFLVSTTLEAALTDAGFVVVGVAASAAEAVRLAQTERPHLAVVDIRLTGEGDGVVAAETMFRELGVRSIFATAHDDADTRKRARQASPLGWVGKPYTPARVIALVRRALAALDE
jgi:DNA-binding NarL/FixJ family response regulator